MAKWLIYARTEMTRPVLPMGMIEATTKIEAEELGYTEHGCFVDAYYVKEQNVESMEAYFASRVLTSASKKGRMQCRPGTSLEEEVDILELPRE